LVKTASFTFNAHKSRSLGEQFFSDLPADYGLFSSLSLNWRKLGAIGDPDSHPSEQGSLGTPMLTREFRIRNSNCTFHISAVNRKPSEKIP
jgi:hypothetical protein